jgi:hypothetical protein
MFSVTTKEEEKPKEINKPKETNKPKKRKVVIVGKVMEVP